MDRLTHTNLNFGDIVQLESVIGGRQRYRVQLLGLLQDVTVMVTAPDAGGHAAAIVEGESLIVRIFTGDEALAFPAWSGRRLELTDRTACTDLHDRWWFG